MSEARPASGTTETLKQQKSDELATATAQAPPTSVEPVAPQDPQAQGAATGEQHAVLGKNVSGSEQKGADEIASELQDEMPGGNPGYHSTGSYTGTSGTGAK